MKISELVKKLEGVKEVYGDLECFTYDTYTANEGYELETLKDVYDEASVVVINGEDDAEHEDLDNDIGDFFVVL